MSSKITDMIHNYLLFHDYLNNWLKKYDENELKTALKDLLKDYKNCKSKEDIVSLFNNFSEKYELDCLSLNLTASLVAKANGYTSERIEMASFVCEQLSQNMKNQLFEQYLKGKTVAIIGNSDREKGRGSGISIDSHDVVCRFNNYPMNNKKDYGTKCNVWIRGLGEYKEIQDRNIADYDYVFMLNGMLNGYTKPHVLNWLYKNLKKYPQKIVYVPPSLYAELNAKYNNPKPTTGFKAILYINQIVGRENLDIYGFSFLDKDGDNDNGHSYDRRTLAGHSMKEERTILREIFCDFS